MYLSIYLKLIKNMLIKSSIIKFIDYNLITINNILI